MTSAEMLTSVRTLLDESSSGFYEDDQIYGALRAGELELATRLFSIYEQKSRISSNEPFPFVLLPLYGDIEATVDIGVATVPLPSGAIGVMNVQYNHEASTPLYPVYVRDIGKLAHFNRKNSILASDKNKHVYYYSFRADSNNIEFEVRSENENAKAIVAYIKKPAGISSSVEPTLAAQTHDAIVQFAYWYIMRKDKEFQGGEFNKFLGLVPSLYF